MNLHDIRTGRTEAIVWAQPYSRGRTVGRGGYSHLYVIRRGDISGYPIDGQPWQFQARRYWSPWGWRPNGNAFNPLCGPLRTTAQRTPYLAENWYNQCPTC